VGQPLRRHLGRDSVGSSERKGGKEASAGRQAGRTGDDANLVGSRADGTVGAVPDNASTIADDTTLSLGRNAACAAAALLPLGTRTTVTAARPTLGCTRSTLSKTARAYRHICVGTGSDA